MLQGSLNDISAFIKEHNAYFNNGYANVYLDEKTGYLYDDGITSTVVFPNDTLGDYFYLRLPKQAQYVYDPQYKMSGCADGIGVKMNVILVACVKNADADKLIENLTITLRNYREVRIRLTNAIFQPEVAILQELSGINEKDQEAALQRLPTDYMVVSVHFEVTEGVFESKLTCIQNPCTC